MFRPILDPSTSKIQVRGLIVSDSLFGCFIASMRSGVLTRTYMKITVIQKEAIRRTDRYQTIGRNYCYSTQIE